LRDGHACCCRTRFEVSDSVELFIILLLFLAVALTLGVPAVRGMR
jgi:hypothetical protein